MSPIGRGVELTTPLAGLYAGSSKDLLTHFQGGSAADAMAQLVAPLYIAFGNVFKLRADVLWAQALHETANFTYPGAVERWQRNFAGIKTRDGLSHASFPTDTLGVKAHFEHMNWYVAPKCLNPCGTVDPRHLGPHQSYGKVITVADLAGKWCPDLNYAALVVKRAKEFGL